MILWFQGTYFTQPVCSKLPHFPKRYAILYGNYRTAVIILGSAVIWFISYCWQMMCLCWVCPCTETKAVSFLTKHLLFSLHSTLHTTNLFRLKKHSISYHYRLYIVSHVRAGSLLYRSSTMPKQNVQLLVNCIFLVMINGLLFHLLFKIIFHLIFLAWERVITFIIFSTLGNFVARFKIGKTVV
jgi:hypothetical protein